MTSFEQQEHQVQTAIHRWENEGGAVAGRDRADASSIRDKSEKGRTNTGHSNSRSGI
jgi:hypothetical protein